MLYAAKCHEPDRTATLQVACRGSMCPCDNDRSVEPRPDQPIPERPTQ
jgi:hypothetical protein